jgi:hypothetical protein
VTIPVKRVTRKRRARPTAVQFYVTTAYRLSLAVLAVITILNLKGN